MTIVVDASIALKWVPKEPGSDAAEELREKDLAAAEAAERLTEPAKAPVASVPLEPDLPEAVRLALQLNHPVYDCLYLALAKRLRTYVVTADRRFGEAVANHRTHVGQVRVLSPMIRGTGPRM